MSKKKKVAPRFVLEMSESQANTLVKALDFFSRIGIGQIEEVENMLHHYGHLQENFDHDAVRNALNFVKRELTGHPSDGSYGIYHQKVPDIFKVAWDLQQVIRHKVSWTANPAGGFGVCYKEPMGCSQEPLAIMEIAKESK